MSMVTKLVRRNGAHQVLLHFSRTQKAFTGMESSQQGSKLQVNVDITSDIVCPWCWVGKRQLDTAVNHLSQDFDFHIRWKPFLLNQHFPVPDEGIPLKVYLQMKFGDDSYYSEQSQLVQHGKTVGITFSPNMLVVPTKKAHILLEYATKEGKQHELQEVLFRSYFAEGKNVNSEPVLRALLEEVGLDPEKALALLQNKKAVERFEDGIREALRKGITSVPHFEFSLKDNPHIKHQFSGAQQVDTFVSVFSRLKMLSKV